MDLNHGRKEMLLRHTKLPKESPWKRGRDEVVLRYGSKRKATMNTIHETFTDYKYVNFDLDITTKRAALRASASVVGLISRPRAGGETLFKASGTIYETTENGDGRYLSGIVTSASLVGSSDEDVDIKIEVYIAGGRMFDGNIVGYDVHYNIAIINILSDVPFPVATLRILDDSVSIDPALVHSSRDNFQLRPHSSAFKFCAEEMVVALGRNCRNFDIMVAPSKFSLDDCKYDCMELMMATCKITKPGVGGPLINCFGEVIGLNFMNEHFTPFLPVNIVDKLLNHFKRYGKFCRPWIGVEATNLYAVEVEELEHIVLNNPNVSRGVYVEAVGIGSHADRAGIECEDVIVQCNGKLVNGFLKFCRKMLDKSGKCVEVGVIRRGYDGIQKLNIAVEEFTPDKFNSWPLPTEYILSIERYRNRK